MTPESIQRIHDVIDVIINRVADISDDTESLRRLRDRESNARSILVNVGIEDGDIESGARHATLLIREARTLVADIVAARKPQDRTIATISRRPVTVTCPGAFCADPSCPRCSDLLRRAGNMGVKP